jgi:hypothetical protein
MTTDTYALREKAINDMIVGANCKWSRLHSGWNTKRSGLGGVWKTYKKIRVGLGPGQVKFINSARTDL